MADEKRISKEEYYLKIAKEVASRSTCYRAAFGAIIVRDDQIVATGYVGAPRKTRDCIERANCLRNKLNIPHGHRYEMCRSVHAEQNAIINSSRAGVSLLGGSMYICGYNPQTKESFDAFPCFICKKMIINAGLKTVFCSTKEGEIKTFDVDGWVRDWQEKDLIDDAHQYGK